MTVTVKRNIESSFRLAPLGQIWSLNQIRSVLIEIRTFCRPKVLLEYADHGNPPHTLYKTWYAFALRIFCWLLFFSIQSKSRCTVEIAVHNRNRSTHSKSQYTLEIAVHIRNRNTVSKPRSFYLLSLSSTKKSGRIWWVLSLYHRYLQISIEICGLYTQSHPSRGGPR